MSKLADPLKTTPLALHRFYVGLTDQSTWYAVMRETRRLYGANWRTQPRIRRLLLPSAPRQYLRSPQIPVWVWFDVPDPVWSTWVSTKLAVMVRQEPPLKNAK